MRRLFVVPFLALLLFNLIEVQSLRSRMDRLEHPTVHVGSTVFGGTTSGIALPIGDLDSTGRVASVSGATPIVWTPNELQFAASATPKISFAAPTSDVATKVFTFVAEPAFASAVTNVNSGGFAFQTNAPVSGSTEATFRFQRVAQAYLDIVPTPINGAGYVTLRAAGSTNTGLIEGNSANVKIGNNVTTVAITPAGSAVATWTSTSFTHANAEIVKTTTVVTTATVGASDYITLCNGSSAFTVTLPAVGSGRTLIIVDISGAAGTNAITVARGGSALINGATSTTIGTNYGSLRFVSNGTNWYTF